MIQSEEERAPQPNKNETIIEEAQEERLKMFLNFMKRLFNARTKK